MDYVFLFSSRSCELWWGARKDTRKSLTTIMWVKHEIMWVWSHVLVRMRVQMRTRKHACAKAIRNSLLFVLGKIFSEIGLTYVAYLGNISMHTSPFWSSLDVDFAVENRYILSQILDLQLSGNVWRENQWDRCLRLSLFLLPRQFILSGLFPLMAITPPSLSYQSWWWSTYLIRIIFKQCLEAIGRIGRWKSWRSFFLVSTFS